MHQKWGMSDKERELGASVHAQHAGSTVHTQLGSMRLMELLNGWGSSLDHLTAQRAMAAIRVAAEGDLERLRHMSSSGIDLTLSDFDGRTALHLAAARGYPSVCLFLIAEGADVNKKGGNSPPNACSRKSNNSTRSTGSTIVQLFLIAEGADVNKKSGMDSQRSSFQFIQL